MMLPQRFSQPLQRIAHDVLDLSAEVDANKRGRQREKLFTLLVTHSR